MEYTSLEIRKIAVGTWIVIPNGVEADLRGQNKYTGGISGDFATIKSINGAQEWKNIPYTVISYTDTITPANNRASFATAQAFLIYANQTGFFAEGGSGTGTATSFDELTDTPDSKTGSAGKAVVVSDDETQLEYQLIPIINNSTDIADFPPALIEGKYLKIVGGVYTLVDAIEGTQNNIGKKVLLGFTDVVPTINSTVSRANEVGFVVSEQETPVLIYFKSFFSTSLGYYGAKNYNYIFLPGKGTYGTGNTTVTSSMLYPLPPTFVTPEDIEDDPNSVTYNLDPVTDGDFISKANTTFWDFTESTYPDEGMNFYFSYTDDGVLYYALFVGTPGTYGSGGTPFTEDDFVTTTSDEVLPIDDNNVSDFNKSYIAAATTGNIRNSEGDVLVLNDGRYISVYSRFDLSTTDQAPASIRGKISSDNTGKEWGNEFIVSPNIGTQNVLSVSLLRIDAITIHCFFLVRNSVTDLGLWRVVSTNEGTTWSAATEVVNEGYTDILSAVVKRSNANRILIPGESVPDGSAGVLNWDIFCYRSDDNGVTYTKSNVVNVPTSSGETSVCWLGGNNVLFSTRSTTGYQWFTKSTDNGTTLGTPYQSTLRSVDAPAQIINYSGTLIALHNPNTTDDRRNPLTISKSTDGGNTWVKITDLENFNNGSNDVRYAYPSLTLDGDNLLISYFELAGKLGAISLKFSKIYISDLLIGVKPSIAGSDTFYLPNLVLQDASNVSPTDDITEAIGKLQTQINQIKGNKFEFTGTGEAINLINDDPSNGLKNLYLSFRNTDGSVVSRLGHIGNDGHYYIYSVNPVTILAPTTIIEGDTILHGKLGVGTNNPLQLAVFSRDGNEGLEIAVDDPVNKIINILAYDRAANVYRQVNLTASKILLDSDVQITKDLSVDLSITASGSISSFSDISAPSADFQYGRVSNAPVSSTDIVRKLELDSKAPLASPALTGTPTAPTASTSTNNTQIATTAFVKSVISANPNRGYAYKNQSSNITLNAADFGDNGVCVIYADATSAAFTITLPTPAIMSLKTVEVVKIDASANAVTIKGDGTTNINASNTYLLTAQFQNTSIKTNAVQYYIV